MPALDDGRQLKVFPGSEESVNGVMLGSKATATQRLLTLVNDIDNDPQVKAYVANDGSVVAAGISAASGSLPIGRANLTDSGIIGTAPSGTGITVGNTAEVRHVMHKVTVDYTAASAAATTKDITLWTLPAKTRVMRVIADVTTPFTGGAVSDCDVTVGSSAGGAEYLLSFDVDSATGTFGNNQAELGASILGGGSFDSDITWGSTTVVQCRFTSSGANLSALTAGVMVVYIECAVYP